MGVFCERLSNCVCAYSPFGFEDGKYELIFILYLAVKSVIKVVSIYSEMMWYHFTVD